MKKIFIVICAAAALSACKQKAPKGIKTTNSDNKQLAKLFDNYYEGYLKLDPLTATSIGDARYNDQLPNTGSVAYLKEAHDFYAAYLDSS